MRDLEIPLRLCVFAGDIPNFLVAALRRYDFRGDRWTNVANSDNRRYLCNAYRVLLTRARQGMVIFVPPGDPGDPTRLPEFYDPTFKYLTDLGIPTVP